MAVPFRCSKRNHVWRIFLFILAPTIVLLALGRNVYWAVSPVTQQPTELQTRHSVKTSTQNVLEPKSKSTPRTPTGTAAKEGVDPEPTAEAGTTTRTSPSSTGMASILGFIPEDAEETSRIHGVRLPQTTAKPPLTTTSRPHQNKTAGRASAQRYANQRRNRQSRFRAAMPVRRFFHTSNKNNNPLEAVHCTPSPLRIQLPWTDHTSSHGTTADKVELYPPQHGVPTFIIAGAQKSGTTALYQLLPQLATTGTMSSSSGKTPVVVAPSRRVETHFFDQTAKLEQGMELSISPSRICQLRDQYVQQEFDWPNIVAQLLGNASSATPLPSSNSTMKRKRIVDWTSLVTFEKCPVYLCKPKIPYQIRQVFPWTKIVLMLRNPADRVFSQWNMIVGKEIKNPARATPAFIDMINRDLEGLHWLGQSTAPPIDMKMLQREHQQSTEGVLREPQHIDNNQSLLFEIPTNQTLNQRSGKTDIGTMEYRGRRSNHQRCGYLSRGMYAQQIESWIDASFQLGVNLHVVRYERFVENRAVVLQEILEFAGITHMDQLTLDNPTLVTDYSPRLPSHRAAPKLTIDPLVREYLSRFYKPYNDELADLLGEEWRNVWQ